MNTSISWLRWGGVIGTIGVLLVAIGEFLMLYSPDGGYGIASDHANFLHPSEGRLKIGFLVSVLSAPLYVIAYDHIARMLKASKSLYLVVMSIIILGFIIGNVWLGTNAYIGFIVQEIDGSTGDTRDVLQGILLSIEQVSNPLLQIARGVILSLSVIIVWKIWRGETHLHKYMIFLNPFLLIIMIFLSFFYLNQVGKYLFPAALNIAHVVFMLFSTYYAFKVRN